MFTSDTQARTILKIVISATAVITLCITPAHAEASRPATAKTPPVNDGLPMPAAPTSELPGASGLFDGMPADMLDEAGVPPAGATLVASQPAQFQ